MMIVESCHQCIHHPVCIKYDKAKQLAAMLDTDSMRSNNFRPEFVEPMYGITRLVRVVAFYCTSAKPL